MLSGREITLVIDQKPMKMGQLIKIAREERGWSQDDLAKMVGVTQPAIKKIEAGQTKNSRHLLPICAALGLEQELRTSMNSLRLISSFDPDQKNESVSDTFDSNAKVMSATRLKRNISPGAIPEFDLRAGASYGGGYALPSQVSDDQGRTYGGEVVKAEWMFPKAYLEGELRLSIASTDIVAIDGPSMIPDLYPGDRVLIDRTHRDPRQGGIFAVREGDGIIVKHVEYMRGSGDMPRIICKSSNPKYDPFELILDNESVAIVGRVAARIARM